MPIFNGWKDAPHHWRTYLIEPLTIYKTESITVVRFFGFVWIKENHNV